ncbi:MAG: glycosyltransferase family 2 protein [Lachnospiraceae bacterium]|nr:glycosyltransferase family 2 protein [Lachnospiraceae bacterium]
MKLSVIMPVFNTKEEFLQASVKSILQQSFSDFEFIIVDDGSYEGCLDCVKEFKDPRIKIIRNEKNLGVSVSSNRALEIAEGEYIARMDSDDIAMPDRFRLQIDYMDNHPEVVVCGTACERVGDGHIYTFLKNNIPRAIICIRLLSGNINLANPTTMIRGSVLHDNNLKYDENIKYALDYALWTDCAGYGDIKVIPRILLRYREHDGQVSKAYRAEQKNCDHYVRMKQVKMLGADFSTEEQEEFLKLYDFNDKIDLLLLNDVINKLEAANNKSNIYEKRYFRYETIRWWLTAIRKSDNPYTLFFRSLKVKRTWGIINPMCWVYLFKYRELYTTNVSY